MTQEKPAATRSQNDEAGEAHRRARGRLHQAVSRCRCKELLARYEQLYTGAINDVLREFCLLEQALPHDIVPLRDQDTVAGIAFTVKSSPNCVIRGEMTFRTKMLDEMHEDAFVVWDTSRDEKATLWGGVMTATAKGKKVRAACIDGGIRDTHQILEQDFPVYYSYRTSNGSLGRCQITHYQVPIKIGRRDDQARRRDLRRHRRRALRAARHRLRRAGARRGDPRQRAEDLRLGRRRADHPPDHGKGRLFLMRLGTLRWLILGLCFIAVTVCRRGSRRSGRSRHRGRRTSLVGPSGGLLPADAASLSSSSRITTRNAG